MTWLDRLRPASFRGVPFRVDAADLASGRRGEDHVYPGRDEPYAEDAGRAPRAYRITGYTIGDDHDLDRDRLVTALEAEGPGTLVHPYFGTVRVVARTFGVQVSTQRGGISVFEIEFVEAGRNLAPSSATDTAGALVEAAGSAGEALEGNFVSRFIADGASWIRDSAITTVERGANLLEAALSPVSSTVGAVDDFRRALLDLRGEVGQLVLEPILLARKIRGLVVQFATLPESTREVFEGLLGMAEAAFDLAPIVEATLGRERESANRRAVEGILHRTALFEAAASVRNLDLPSRDDVIAVRERLSEAFEAEILLAGDDPEQDADLAELERVFAAAMRELAARDNGTLARLRVITLPAAQPALALAHRLYQDADRDQEIVDRNHVPHPLFVPGGVPLRVLTSG